VKSRSAKIDRGKKNLKEIKRKKEQIAERRIMRNGDIIDVNGEGIEREWGKEKRGK
jgi:hypothetical protein